MKIVAPLNRSNEINSLIQAGADELYSGLVDYAQWQKFGGAGCINRRAETFSNLNSVDELRKSVDIAHRHNIPFVLTLNEYYDEAQCREAIHQAQIAVDNGVDAILVADIGLMLVLKEKFKRLKLYLSSCAPVFNSETISFYSNLGVSRIVFHRHLSMNELKELSSKVRGGLELEAFVLNERCYNIDGFCSFEHGKCTNIFGFKAQQHVKEAMKKYIRLFPQKILNRINNYLVKESHPCCFPFRQKTTNGFENVTLNTEKAFLYACGLCAIYELNSLGVSHIKISGRSMLTDQVKNIRLVKEALMLLENVADRNEFILGAEKIAKRFGRSCGPVYCYHRA
jgi:collagenase-like PrtC family protease